MSDNVRIISTNCFGRRAYEILRNVKGQLSDGIWENSRAMDNFWRFFSVNIDSTSGEVTLLVGAASGGMSCNRWLRNGFAGMDEAKIREWIACKLRCIVNTEKRDTKCTDIRWSPKCGEPLDYFSEGTTVAAVVAVYDALLGRAKEARFEVKAVSNFASKKIESLKTKITQCEDRIKQLDEKRNLNIKKINDEFYAVQQDLTKKIFEMRKQIEVLGN